MCKYYGSFDYCEYCNKGNRSCCVALENHKKNHGKTADINNAKEFIVNGKKRLFRGTSK